MSSDHWNSHSLLQEFLRQQLPILALVLGLGFGSAYLQHGFLPGADVPFPLADVRVPIWHLIWLGVWTGYTMALVGQAAGIVALPYSTSILQFSNPHVTPTMLVLTLINPLGALLGFRRSGQWNLDLAAAVCAGGAVGGLIGPFLRATILSEADTFRLVLGLALAVFGVQLCYRSIRDYKNFGALLGSRFLKEDPDGDVAAPSKAFSIDTVARTLKRIDIRFGAEQRSLSNLGLFAAGLGVGLFSAALGVGGGFLLVPIFAIVWRVPIYIMVAATIPYTIVLSTTGILTFIFALPMVGIPAIDPEWAWGFFCAAGGVLGSWWASKTQIHVPEHLLGGMLGTLTGGAGILYLFSAMAGMLLHWV